jgi:ABC-type amino acid transport substrate-binding protein
VPFLLDMFRIPADTFQLFIASGVINARFGTLVAAMHTLAVALLGSCAMAGTLRWNKRRVVRYLVITGVLTVAVIGGTRMLFGRALNREYSKDKVLAKMHLLHQPTEAVVHRTPLARTEEESGPRLDVIRHRGVLTVGFVPDSLPYAFFNANDDLVGLDIDLAHRLAIELGVKLEFVAVTRDRLVDAMDKGECDIVMSGIVVTTLRASRMVFSDAYLDETLAFIVPDRRRDEFMTWERLREKPGIRLGIPDLPYYVQKLKERLPQANLQVVSEALPFFATDDHAGLDGLAFAAERGSAWTLMYPKLAVVIPEPDLVKVPLAYPVAAGDQAFVRFINTWIELKRKDGTIDGLYKYWILGQDAAPKQPRWSIMRNVLHWTK